MENQKTNGTLTKFTPQPNLTPEKFLLNKDYPAVLTLTFKKGFEAIVNELIPIAYEYLTLIEVGNKMSPSAVYMTLKEMISDFPDWSVEDFRYFFKGFAKGNYNEKFFRLDMSVIYDGAKMYELERTTAREKIIEKKKAELEPKKIDPEKVITKYSEDAEKFIDGFLSSKKVEPADVEDSNIKKLTAEAKEIWNKLPKKLGEVKKILHNGVWEEIRMSEDIIQIGTDSFNQPIYQSFTSFKNEYIKKQSDLISQSK